MTAQVDTRDIEGADVIKELNFTTGNYVNGTSTEEQFTTGNYVNGTSTEEQFTTDNHVNGTSTEERFTTGNYVNGTSTEEQFTTGNYVNGTSTEEPFTTGNYVNGTSTEEPFIITDANATNYSDTTEPMNLNSYTTTEEDTPAYGTRRPPQPCYGSVPTPPTRPSQQPAPDYDGILEVLHRGYYEVSEYNLTYQADAWFYSVGYSEITSYPPCPTDYDNSYTSDDYPYERGYTGGENRYPAEYYEGGEGGEGGDDDIMVWGPPCERQEYRQLTDQQRGNFHAALNAMKNNIVGGISEYDIFASKHIGANSPGAHGGAAFLPWHREYLRR